MKKLLFILFFFVAVKSVYSQDLIIKKNGDEIKSKVLEVALNIIKYKKYDNLNGPTFEILKSEVFIIKYENGTKDIINPIEEKKTVTKINTEKVEVEPTEKLHEGPMAFTEKHRSFSIIYGISALFGGITNFGNVEKSMVYGPVLFSFDRALSKKFDINYRPAIMYYNYSYLYNNGNYYSGNSGAFFGGMQVRVNYHFAVNSKIDPYFGVSGGAGYFFGSGGYSGVKGVYPIYGGGFGMKAYGKKTNALLLELGFDSYSYLKVGYVFGSRK